MKRKTSKITSLALGILASILLIVFNDPYDIGFSWNIFLAVLLLVIALIIQLAVSRCPNCDRLIANDSLIRPYKNRPFCGATLGD